MQAQERYHILKDYISASRLALFDERILDRTRHITMVLENLSQPHNFSAVMRSCDCFGIQDLHIIENDKQYETRKRVARGSGKWINLHRYNTQSNNTEEALTSLKTKGYKIVATSPQPKYPTPSQIDMSLPIALVMGSEWDGISDVVHQYADEYLHIPMYGFTESFNVSVAAALILQRLTERMRHETKGWQLTEEEQASTLAQWASTSVKDSERILERFLQEQNR